MDVVDVEQARIAEEAGACAVMALERVPADIRKDGGVARMSDPDMIKKIKEAVTIPVMAKARIGHFVEAQVNIFVALALISIRFCKPLESTILMRARCLPPRMRTITFSSMTSRCLLYVAPKTSGKLCAAFLRVPPLSAPR